MGGRDEHQAMLDVVVRYYLEDKTQSQIGKEFNISRSTVSRLLKRARETGVITFFINYQSEEIETLQEQIKKMFRVRRVLLTKTIRDDGATLREVSKLAVKELESHLHDKMTIGVSWGRHIEMVSKNLGAYDYEGISIVEIFGAIGSRVNRVDTQSVSRKICEQLNARLYPLAAPIFIFDEAGRREVRASKAVKATLEKIDECELILTSIGAIELDPWQTLWHEYLSEDVKNEIIGRDGAGFILAHFFDRNGAFLDHAINDSIIGIRTDVIRAQKIFAIASGATKAPAILGALRGGLLDTLISDEQTLRRVLELAQTQQ